MLREYKDMDDVQRVYGCGGCSESIRMWRMFREYKDVEDVCRV